MKESQPSINSSVVTKSSEKLNHSHLGPQPQTIASHQEEWFSDWENFSERVGETQVQVRSGLEVGEENKSKKTVLANLVKISKASQGSVGGVFRSQIFVDGMHCSACLLYTSPSPRDRTRSRMPSSA